MIVLDNVIKQTNINSSDKKVLMVSLLADTASEVSAIGTSTDSIKDMPSDSVLAPFSIAFTAAKELGVLQSDGTWNFDN